MTCQLGNIVTSSRFAGCIEDLRFDEVVIGLWNFIYADRTSGCEARSFSFTEALTKNTFSVQISGCCCLNNISSSLT